MSSYNFHILCLHFFFACIKQDFLKKRKKILRAALIVKFSFSPCFLLSVSTNKALGVKTKALQCGILVLNIMTLWGSSSSYGEGLFLVCSHMKCHLEFDKIWRSNPLWELHWTAHFLILFSCYNQALTGDPCHCVIKLIICRKNYCRLCCLEVRGTGSVLYY